MKPYNRPKNRFLQNCNVIVCKSLIIVILVTTSAYHVIAKPESEFERNEGTLSDCPSVPTVTILEESVSVENESSTVHVFVRNGNGEMKESISSNKINVSCISSHPITWKYELPEAGNSNEIVRFTDISRTAKNPLNDTTNCYNASVTLEIPRNYIGRYACVGKNETRTNDSNSLVYFSSTRMNITIIQASFEKLSHAVKSESSDDLQIQVSNHTTACTNNMASFTCKSNQQIPDGALRLKILGCENPMHCNLLWKAYPNYLRTIPFMNSSSSSNGSCPFQLSGLVICSNENGTKYQVKYFQPEPEMTTEYVEETSGVSPKLIYSYIDKCEGDIIGFPINLNCYSSQFYFARGSQFMVKYKNDSLLPPLLEMVLSSSSTTFNGHYIDHWSVNISSSDIKRYYCYAPLINSSQWKTSGYIWMEPNHRRTMQILNDPRTSESEVTFFDISRNNPRLSCLTAGFPVPEIVWYRNGKEFSYNKRQVNATRNTADSPSVLEFDRILSLDFDLDGNWSCRAVMPNCTEEYHEHVIRVKGSHQDMAFPDSHHNSLMHYVLGYFVHLKQKEGEFRNYFNISADDFKKLLEGDQSCYLRLREEMNEELRVATASPEGLTPERITKLQDQLNELSRRVVEATKFDIPREKLLRPKDIGGSFTEDTKLGEGNYGLVYRASFKTTNVAVKIPKIETPPKMKKQNARISPALVADLKAIKNKNTENLLAIVEELKTSLCIGKTMFVIEFIGAALKMDKNGGSIQVVLELCKTNLKKYLEENSQSFRDSLVTSEVSSEYSMRDLNRWSWQIACAMEYLSELIIHRDLAARNILLKRNEITGELDPWNYAAPELMNTMTVTFSQATDIWSFGITLWEIYTLAENIPFSDYDSDRFRSEIERERLPRLNPEEPQFASQETRNIMRRCLSKNPASRPTFRELVGELRPLIGNHDEPA